jgi:hypothetical protein
MLDLNTIQVELESLPETIKLTPVELQKVELINFTIEGGSKGTDVIFHVNATGKKIVDNEIIYKIVPKMIINALRNVIPKSFEVFIVFVPEMNSWAVRVKGLGLDIFVEKMIARGIEALSKMFKSGTFKEVIL